jgi:hypothetical protein
MKMPNTAALSLFLVMVALSACDLTFTPPDPTPPGEPVQVAITQAPTDFPTPSSALAVSQPVSISAASPCPRLRTRPSPAQPTETPTPTETLGPYEYVIQPNDTLYLHHSADALELPYSFDVAVASEILRLNPNITSVDRLPPPGSRILIPRPTVPPTPLGYELTVAARPPALQTAQPEGTMQVMEVVVREGDTILGIAEQNNTTLSVLRRLNPQLAFLELRFQQSQRRTQLQCPAERRADRSMCQRTYPDADAVSNFFWE